MFILFYSCQMIIKLYHARFPSTVTTNINGNNPLTVTNDLDGTNVSIYLSSSPNQFCPEGRDVDIDAILRHIDEAQEFVHVKLNRIQKRCRPLGIVAYFQRWISLQICNGLLWKLQWSVTSLTWKILM